MNINIDSQIVVQTAAQWAADNTVYSAKRILVTSDVYYGSTDQRKFKIADGVQTWSNLDYMPIEQVTTSTIGSAINGAASGTPNDTDLVMSVDTSVAKKNTWTQIKAFLKTYFDTVYATAASLSGKEDTSNKSSSYTASSTTTYANTKALVDGLATKLDATTERLLFVGGFSALNLADSSTYYFSALDGLAAQTTQGLAKFSFNQNRTITKILLTCSQGTNYSNENVSVYLRENATTDNTITTTLDLNSVGSNGSRIFAYTVSIAVLAASTYEFKIVTPAFGTNGTNSRWIVQLYGY